MLYLNPNKEKILTFEVELSGATHEEVHGFVRFFITDNTQVGFPVVVGHNEIKAVITPLKELVKKPIKNGTVFEAQLDLYTTDQDYFSPWKGEIEIKMPVMIEAKLNDEDETVFSKSFGVKAKVVKEKKSPSPLRKTTSEDGGRNGLTEEEKKWTKNKLKNITHEQIREYIAKNKTKNPAIQDIIISEATKAAGTGDKYKVFVEVVKALKSTAKRS